MDAVAHGSRGGTGRSSGCGNDDLDRVGGADGGGRYRACGRRGAHGAWRRARQRGLHAVVPCGRGAWRCRLDAAGCAVAAAGVSCSPRGFWALRFFPATLRCGLLPDIGFLRWQRHPAASFSLSRGSPLPPPLCCGVNSAPSLNLSSLLAAQLRRPVDWRVRALS